MRRYKNESDIPDLILIDGGKGQLNAVKDLFPNAEFAALAKREETIFSKRIPNGKKLDIQNFGGMIPDASVPDASVPPAAGQFLIELRDYAHHFAINYHRKLDRII